MVRIIRPLDTEYGDFNGGGTDAAKRTALAVLLGGLNPGGGGKSLHDFVEDNVADYYTDLVKDPGNMDQARQIVVDLGTISTAAAGPFPAADVIQKLTAIDDTLVAWTIARFNGRHKSPGWRSEHGKFYDLARISHFPGLSKSFEDVKAGRAANQFGTQYNDHPYHNAEKRLPPGPNYNTFDWIAGDGTTRGNRRGVYGSDNSLYVTAEHYSEGSFTRIVATGTNPVIAPPPPFIAS